MDIFSHALWAGAGAKICESRFQGIPVRWTAWWGVFPDLFAFLPAIVVGSWTVYQTTGSVIFTRQSWPLELAWDLYQISHSFITFLVVAAVVWIVQKAWRSSQSWKEAFPYALLAWPFHIMLDIPTHRLGFFATPFLWPINDYRFPYGFSWGRPWFMTFNLVALIIMYMWLWKRTMKS